MRTAVIKRTYYERLRGSFSRTAIIASAGLLLTSAITLLLIPNIMLSSFKTKRDLINNTLGFPKSFTLEHYRAVFMEDQFFRYFLNSILLATAALFCLLLVASMTAYGLSRYRFRGRGVPAGLFPPGDDVSYPAGDSADFHHHPFPGFD